MRRKWAAVVLAIVFVLAGNTLVLARETDEAETSTIDLKTSVTDRNNLTWELEDGVLTVSGNGVMEQNPFDSRKEEVTSLVINKGVIEIDHYLFTGYENLREVTIPEGINQIGFMAFARCTSLSEIVIPRTVNGIGFMAFGGCTSLRELFFMGDAPELVYLGDVELDNGSPFFNVTANAYYPEGNGTWTEEKRLALGRTLNWIAVPQREELQIISEATDDTYRIGSEIGATIVCTGKLEEFINVFIDGKEVGKDSYTVKEGSTVLSFGTDYLDGLAVGKHTVTLNYSHGSIDTELTVLPAEKEQIPLEIIPEATDGTYILETDETITITCTGELEDFTGVFVDGNKIDESNYMLKDGSTILTFISKYLNTLTVGKHRVTLNYTYGSVDTELTVLAHPKVPDKEEPANTEKPTHTEKLPGMENNVNTVQNTDSVNTGDSASSIFWMLTALTALSICVGMLKWRKGYM